MGISQYIHFARSLVFHDRPIYAHFAVTDKCDLRCKACSIWRREEPAKELTIDQIRELAAVLKTMGSIHVSLGGGEPVIRNDLPEILDIFNQTGLRTRVLTNGVAMTPDKAKPLLDAGLREVSFSLDSLDPDTQSYLDGQKGTFAKRIDNLFFIAKNLPSKKTTPIINTMVTAKNIHQIFDILNLAKSIGFYLSLIPIHLTKQNDHRFFGTDKTLSFDPEYKTLLNETFARLIKEKKAGAPIINSSAFLKNCPQFLIAGKSNWSCMAGETYISISPNGTISPCHRFENEWGIHYSKFPKVFKTAQYKSDLKEKVADCPGCFRPCWTEISFLLTDRKSLLEMIRNQNDSRKSRPPIDEDAIRKNLGLGEKSKN